MSNQEVIEKLRGFVSTLRRTPQPISEVIPYLVLAADRLEECLKHNEDKIIMDKYFAYSNDCGIEFFETEQEAVDWCNDEIQYYREQAGMDEWSDDVESVCYGKVIAKSFEQVIDEEHSDFKLGKIDD